MRKAPWIAASTLVAAFGAIAADPPTVFHLETASKWGKPAHVVAPEYPREALDRGQTGYVDVEGTIGALRQMTVLRYLPDTPASEVFVAAVRQVISYWGFHPPIGSDCQPSSASVMTRVWFELQDGKPRISVAKAAAPGPDAPTLVPTFSRDPAYPRSAMREGLQAYTYSRLDVGPDGNVLGVNTEVYPKEGPSREAFARENEQSFSRWTFPPAASAHRTVCVQAHFRLRD